MQTFLPHQSFLDSAKVLDWRRLGKQRVECLQLLKALESGGGWSSHPACLMWTGYEDALKHYFNVIVREWVSRGYRNNLDLFDDGLLSVAMPPWLGDEQFHRSHRVALLRKNPGHYHEYWPNEEVVLAIPLDQVYWWPVLNDSEEGYRLRKKGQP